jgi:cytochrome P450
MSVSSSIPRFVDLSELRTNPLLFLQAAQSVAGSLVVISENGPLFSRARHCPATVAVFGPTGIRQVLNDADTFGNVVSVGEFLSLPPKLMRLNAGLFSMRGGEHRDRQQLLISLLGADSIFDFSKAISEAWESFVPGIRERSEIPLLTEMRRLALHVSERIIFGNSELELGRIIQSYFETHRSYPLTPASPAGRRILIRMANRLDHSLRTRLNTLRSEAHQANQTRTCVLARLATMDATGEQLADDELISHGNVLFISSSEPVAVTLTWTLLLLSQSPELRCAIRQELLQARGRGEPSEHPDDSNCPLLKAVIQESLRLLPPNAIMVRLTTRSTRLLSYEVPQYCEVVLSSFVAHRDPNQFVNPNVFQPLRWRNLQPPPYAYFPFGIGARYCVGRRLANLILTSLLARILSHYDVFLSKDQDLDWKINITLMPASDPVVRFAPVDDGRKAQRGGRLGGPVGALVHFEDI